MEYREFRAESVGSNDEGRLFGLVTPFGRETTIGDLKRGGFRELITRGAFTKTLREADVVLVYHHDMSKPLARMSAGNLELREADDGVHFDAQPIDTSYARDLRAQVDSKVIGGMSFGFNVVKERWTDDNGKPSDRYSGTRREVLEVAMVEASPVTKPAYGGTSISARDEVSALLEERAAYGEEGVAEWRASNLSAADRKALAAKGHALPDGSYPIPDKEHLHAAAVLAASHHGNWQAAKRLIRKRAKELGVSLDSLPGFGKEDNAEEFDGDVRDDPDGKEFAAIDAACDFLEASPPNVERALECLLPCRAGNRPRSEETSGESRDEQKPESATSAEDERRFDALRITELLSRVADA
jgi:HK97 family phage prohead protease